MSLLKIRAIILFLIAFSVACKKEEEAKPVADFTFDKTEYMAGELIRLTNTSVNAETFRWTLPDGTTSRDQNPSFQTAKSQEASNPTFKIEAFSKSGDKTDYIVKSISLKETRGTLLLYGELGFSTSVDIEIDSQKQGSYTIPPSSGTNVPECGQPGYPQFSLPLGPHLIKYVSTPWSTTVIVQITGNSCHKLKLY
jgi:PKD repeat protein